MMRLCRKAIRRCVPVSALRSDIDGATTDETQISETALGADLPVCGLWRLPASLRLPNQLFTNSRFVASKPSNVYLSLSGLPTYITLWESTERTCAITIFGLHGQHAYGCSAQS